MNAEEQYNQLRIKCHDQAFHRYGYSYIFKKRAERFKWRINLIKTLGIIVPAAVGSIALSYSSDSWILKLAIGIAIPAMAIQFILSLWAVLYKWDEELAYCYESMPSHSVLYSKLKHLGQFPPTKFKDLENQFEKLEIEINLRSQLDGQHNIKSWETRMGMRWSLREHQDKCIKCEIQPFGMTSTNCEVCGNFNYIKHQLFNK